MESIKTEEETSESSKNREGLESSDNDTSSQSQKRSKHSKKHKHKHSKKHKTKHKKSKSKRRSSSRSRSRSKSPSKTDDDIDLGTYDVGTFKLEKSMSRSPSPKNKYNTNFPDERETLKMLSVANGNDEINKNGSESPPFYTKEDLLERDGWLPVAKSPKVEEKDQQHIDNIASLDTNCNDKENGNLKDKISDNNNKETIKSGLYSDSEIKNDNATPSRSGESNKCRSASPKSKSMSPKLKNKKKSCSRSSSPETRNSRTRKKSRSKSQSRSPKRRRYRSKDRMDYRRDQRSTSREHKSYSRSRRSPSTRKRSYRRSRSPSPRKRSTGKSRSSSPRKWSSRSPSPRKRSSRKSRSRSPSPRKRSSRKSRSRSPSPRKRSSRKARSRSPSPRKRSSKKSRSRSASPRKRSSRKSRSPSPRRRSSRHSRSRSPVRRRYRNRSTSRSRRSRSRTRRSRSRTRRSRSRNRRSRSRTRRSRSRTRHSRSRNRRSRSRTRRSRSRSRRKSRSRSKSQDRSNRRSRSPDSDSDKKIITKTSDTQGSSSVSTVAIDSIGKAPAVTDPTNKKSLAMLTEFCKKLTEARGIPENDETADKNDVQEEEEEEGDDGVISHPFLVAPKKDITIPNVIFPVKAMLPPINMVDSSKPLTEQFPVSCGTKHHEKEAEDTRVMTIPDVNGSAIQQVQPHQQQQNVFHQPQEKLDISGLVAKRMDAQRRLQANANDVDAMLALQEIEMKLNNWCQSNVKPGQFTGQLAKQLMPKEKMNSGYQCWAKKDMFQNLNPVSGGVGMKLLQKMGWSPGQVLGKSGKGNLEPIALQVKVDRKGLSSTMERPAGKKGGPTVQNMNANASMDLQGKHPISLLQEYCARKKWNVPDFTLIFDEGPPHSKQFLFKVLVNGWEYQHPVVSGNKKHAKAQAAVAALKGLGLVPEDAQF